MSTFRKENVDLSLHYNDDQRMQMRIMRGKALYDADGNDFKFVENPPAGPRSKEIARTKHGRLIFRKDGLYTLSLRGVNSGDKYIGEELVAETRTMMKAMQEDAAKRNKKVVVTVVEPEPECKTSKRKGVKDGKGK